jgi:uncharacterized protein (TIGR02246 family)
MSCRTPESLMVRFGQLVQEGNLDQLIALYEPGAVFVPAPGVRCEGHEAIRAALAEMLALEPTMEVDIEEVLVSADLALVINAWKMTGTAPDGTIVRQEGRSADVLRRQADGSWLVSIDHP